MKKYDSCNVMVVYVVKVKQEENILGLIKPYTYPPILGQK